MKSFAYVTAFAVGIGTLGTASYSHAGSLDVKLDAYKGQNVSIDPSPNYNGQVYASAFDMKVTGGDQPSYLPDNFVGFCIDLDETIKKGTHTYNEGSLTSAPLVGSGSASFSIDQTKADNLGKWYGKYFNDFGGNDYNAWTPKNAAFFQVGVWEIIVDGGGGNFNLTEGNFITTSGYANGYDAGDWMSAGSLKLRALTSDSVQDVAVVVPSPVAAMSLLPMLGGLLLMRRNRASRRSA